MLLYEKWNGLTGNQTVRRKLLIVIKKRLCDRFGRLQSPLFMKTGLIFQIFTRLATYLRLRKAIYKLSKVLWQAGKGNAL